MLASSDTCLVRLAASCHATLQRHRFHMGESSQCKGWGSGSEGPTQRQEAASFFHDLGYLGGGHKKTPGLCAPITKLRIMTVWPVGRGLAQQAVGDAVRVAWERGPPEDANSLGLRRPLRALSPITVVGMVVAREQRRGRGSICGSEGRGPARGATQFTTQMHHAIPDMGKRIAW